MKNGTLIEWLQELPANYEINISQYISVVIGEDSEEYFMVLDDPIVGILKNDETKEIRFFTRSSEERVIREIENGKKWRKFD